MSQRSHGSVRLISLAGALVAWSAVVLAQSAPPIIEAVKAGDLEAVRTQLANGADINARQGDGATALHWAAHRDDLEAVRMLLAAGAQIDIANDLGATPLWLAATNGGASVVEQLLDGGANPNVALARGETPLMAAARSGTIRAVALLLERGADPNTTERERGQTALMWAAAQRHADVARLLIAHGADLHARSTVWDQLENTAGNTNPSGNFRMAHGGSTALLFGARNGDVATAQVLVEGGADVNDTAAAGTSALIVAAHSGQTPLAVYLLEQGADPNAAEAGYTALHAAVLRGQPQLVAALLDHGADAGALVAHGTPGRRFGADYSIRHQLIGANAFWLAAKYGELQIVRLLAAHGADASVTPDSNGMSALQAAMGVPQISQENRRNRVGVPWPDTDDEQQRILELARITLDLGVDVNTADFAGNTALHHAVRRGFYAVVEFLAEQGADVNVTNERDQTPLRLAETAKLARRNPAGRRRHQRPPGHPSRDRRAAAPPRRGVVGFRAGHPV